tara:strand:+ start:102 stop:320 length:219 start_codon:yes stop_codon:yes gene_type:complete
MSKIQEKINSLVDEIQSMMEANAHLDDDPEKLEKLEKLLAKTSIYWAHMDDENTDYIQAIQDTIKRNVKWDL